jgi:Alpha/beta hydrolase family
MSSTGSLSRLQTASGLITVVLMFVIGCQRQDSSASSVSSDHQVAHYVRRGSGARVIVFVHGIFGGATSTWSYSSAVSWPDMLKSDSIFDGSDIYVASYDSPYHGNQMTIDEVVESLNSRFDSDKVFAEHREVVFVAHSLGGLVVQRYLLTRRELANQVSFIYFFSTPETGANVAKLGRVFNADPLLKEMLPGDSNDYLLNMENEWRNAHFSIHRYCAYEKEPIKGVLIVDRLSSTRNCEVSIPINASHISIVKPADSNAGEYIALRNAIAETPLISHPSHGVTRSDTRSTTCAYDKGPKKGLIEYFPPRFATAAEIGASCEDTRGSYGRAIVDDPSKQIALSSVCHFTSGSHSGQSIDYAPMEPIPVGMSCQDGADSTGFVAPK